LAVPSSLVRITPGAAPIDVREPLGLADGVLAVRSVQHQQRLVRRAGDQLAVDDAA
jgi:hypothetical protein